MNLKIGEREMLHNKVCSVLRKAILKGELKAGEKLVQSELAEVIGVSRMPIREALRTLEIERLITIEPHKGAVVRSISKHDIEEIYELRTILEPLALRKSVRNLSKQDLDALKSNHEDMMLASGDDYTKINKEFHQTLLSRCESPRLMAFIETISHGFTQETPEIIPGQIEKSNKEHARILEAIIQGHSDKAADYLAKHIERSGIELVASLQK